MGSIHGSLNLWLWAQHINTSWRDHVAEEAATSWQSESKSEKGKWPDPNITLKGKFPTT